MKVMQLQPGGPQTLLAEDNGLAFGAVMGAGAEERARRIVAAFNACAGLTVEELEEAAAAGDLLIRESDVAALDDRYTLAGV